MDSLPTGTVTFLLTDIEGSTPLQEQYPEAMRAALPRHDSLAATLISQHRGFLMKKQGEGDSLFAVFARATDAVAAACDLQCALQAEPWPEPIVLRVRMALHTGEADLRDGDYFGRTVNRCARLRSIAHGGQTLLSRTTYDLVDGRLAAQIGFKDLGLHRLKDLDIPEHVHQLLHTSLSADFPPLKSLDILPNNLPQQLTSFIGRQKELEEVEQALTESFLLTLKGTGGCGKTRLSLQAAANVLEQKQFRDGVWLVELVGLTDPDRVPQAVASVLGVRETAESDLTTSLIHFLQAKYLLLVLDNCEHLREACAYLAERLLTACPSLRILTTSRDALHIGPEQIYEVPPFPVPDPANLPPLDQLERQEAMRLFMERARAVKSRFQLTPENAVSIANICRRLDGLPFAIELVAAQVNAMSVKEIEADLFSLLEEVDGSETAHDRHRTFEALMDWSFELLKEPELQILLRRLSVFAGGWDLKSAKMVCSGKGVTDAQIRKLLRRLGQASLIVTETQNETTRFRLLETVRAYARGKLEEADEIETIQDRHVDFFLGLAEGEEPYLNRKEQAEGLARLETEHDNFRQALNLAVNNETRLRLAGALWRFWAMRSYFSEGRARLKQALAHTRGVTPNARAKALNGLGVLSMRQSEYGTARPLLEESLQLYQDCDNPRGVAEVLNNLGTIAQQQGDFLTAQAHFETSRKIAEEQGDPWSVAAACSNLGTLARSQGNLLLARSYYQQSNAIYRKVEDTTRILITLINLGIVENDLEDYSAARPLLEESVAIARQQRNNYHLAFALHNLGFTLYQMEGSATAIPIYLECLMLQQELGDKIGIIYLLGNLSEAFIGTGLLEQAICLAGAAEHLRKDYGISLLQSEQDQVTQHISSLRELLSKENFEAAWAFGITMNLEEAIVFALQTTNT